jgi:hypothetical protein
VFALASAGPSVIIVDPLVKLVVVVVVVVAA